MAYNSLRQFPMLSGKQSLPALRKPKPVKPESPFGMWGSRAGKRGMPLDLGVTLAGMLAHSIAPDEWGGRMGKDLASLGGTMYGQRMMHELDTPEREMRRRLGEAQIKTAERDPMATFKAKREITAPERELTGRLTRAQITKAEAPELIKGARGEMVEKAPGAKFYEAPKIGTGKWIQGEGGTWKHLEAGETGKGILEGLTPSAQLSQRKLDAWDAHKKGTATTEQKELIKVRTGITPKEQRTGEAKIKAADTKHARTLRKELRGARTELAGSESRFEHIPDDRGKIDPRYTQIKRNIQGLENRIRSLTGTKEPIAKKWDIAEVKAILKKGGMSQTDANIEQFMKMNPR